MQIDLGPLGVFLVALAAPACTSVVPREPTSATTEPIINGQQINNRWDAISFRIPQSTVRVRTTGGSCTGVLISETKVLTAAHCSVDANTLVYQYPVYADTAHVGSAAEINVGNPVSSVLKATTCVPYASGCKDSTGNFADLAVLTLTNPLPQAHTFVVTGVANQYASYQAGSLWVAGTGYHNGVDNSASWIMQWAPAKLTSMTDRTGAVWSEHVNTNDGDSGGPLYATLADGSLILIGILSGSNTSLTSDAYTSVVSGTNWQWVQNQVLPTTRDIVVPMGSPPEFFGASASLGAAEADEMVLLPHAVEE